MCSDNRKLLYWGRRWWFWIMLCLHQREPLGVWYFYCRITCWTHAMHCVFELIWYAFLTCSGVGDQVSVGHVWTWAAFPRSWCTRRPCWAQPYRMRASSAGSLSRQVRPQSTDLGGHEGGTLRRLAGVNRGQTSSVLACFHSFDSADSCCVCAQWNTTGRPWRRRWTTTLAP